MPRGVTTSIPQAISTAYETAETSVLRTPPDLPSLLLRERIIYLGLPLFSDDQVKQQLGKVKNYCRLILGLLAIKVVIPSLPSSCLLHSQKPCLPLV